MGQVASELLAGALREPDGAAPPPVDWISRPLGSPRVDLDDKEAVGAALDGRG